MLPVCLGEKTAYKDELSWKWGVRDLSILLQPDTNQLTFVAFVHVRLYVCIFFNNARASYDGQA